MDINERHSIAHDLENALRNILWPKRAYEPDYVAKLVSELPRIITKVLSSNMPGRQIKAGGAFKERGDGYLFHE